MTQIFTVGRRVFYQRNDGWWGCGTNKQTPKAWHRFLWSLLLSKGI